MRTDWDKITEEAFESDEMHIFSEDYCRRRAEIQGGITMEKKRENIKRRRFSASAAAAAAALVLIPAGTVGAIHFASSGSKNSGEKYGAQVETTTVTETLAAEETSAADIEASAINEDTGEEVAVKTRYMAVPDPLPDGWVAIDGVFARKYSYIDQAEDEGSTIARENSENSSYVSYYMLSGEVYDDVYKELSGKSEVVGWPEPESPRLEKSVTEFKHDRDDGYDRDILIKFKDSDDFVALAVYYDVKQEYLYDLVQSFKLVKVDETTIPQASDENKAINEDNGEKVPVAEAEEAVQVDDSITNIEYNYLPEGLVRDENNFKFRYYIDGEFQGGGITPLLSKCSEGVDFDSVLDEYFNREGDHSESVEEYDVGEGKDEKHVYISYNKGGPREPEFEGDRRITEEDWKYMQSNGWYNRKAVVRFADGVHYAELEIHSSLNDEELRKFIEGMNLRLNQALTSEGK